MATGTFFPNRGMYSPIENKLLDTLLAFGKNAKVTSAIVAVKAGCPNEVQKSYRFCARAFASSQEGKRREDGCGLVNLGEGIFEWREPSTEWPDWHVRE